MPLDDSVTIPWKWSSGSPSWLLEEDNEDLNDKKFSIGATAYWQPFIIQILTWSCERLDSGPDAESAGASRMSVALLAGTGLTVLRYAEVTSWPNRRTLYGALAKARCMGTGGR